VAPLLATMTGDALAVDLDGHLAAAIGSRTPDRVALPEHLSGGPVWLPTLGSAVAEPLAGGWLLRLGHESAGPATRLVLDLTGSPLLRVSSESGAWDRRLSPRHAEIVLALVEAGPAGRTATALAEDLFAGPDRVVTVRAEMSRLRRAVGSVLLSHPYRIAPAVAASLALPADLAAALPGSSAPVVRRLLARSD
jgi:hypothetical protein